MENKELAMPVSMDYLPVAGDIEDIATNAPRVVERMQQQIDNSSNGVRYLKLPLNTF
jgi:histidine ammonia-lyase